jgi:hypothetical protein
MNPDVETRLAVLEAKVEAQDVAGLRRELSAMATEMRAGFASVRGAIWAVVAIGGIVGFASVAIGLVLTVRGLF